ncbi:hypothetical protein [Cupriavidus gilardii]|uniref:hypothetical protein n=1 Tax=Cupriavidus gilardii TaxID=82541 RepID=UPI0015730CFB|nr:hypothetical protein [Cupriavidus gilardii]NSX04219.1 hypothetical protein [Cupriavidus gilardii]
MPSSRERTTCPSSRAFSRRRGEAGSVFSRSLSSDMAAPWRSGMLPFDRVDYRSGGAGVLGRIGGGLRRYLGDGRGLPPTRIAPRTGQASPTGRVRPHWATFQSDLQEPADLRKRLVRACQILSASSSPVPCPSILENTMPLEFVISSSGAAIAAASRHPAPPASDGIAMPPEAGRIRLDTLPKCVLAQVAGRLDAGATVALCRASKRLHAALERDFAAPIRLAERLPWIVANGAFQRWLRDAQQIAPAQLHRLPVMAQLQHLHPDLRQRALGAMLSTLSTTPPAQRADSFDTVLALARANRVGPLTDWIRSAPGGEFRLRGTAEWVELALTLPACGCTAMLDALAIRLSRENVGQWRDLLDAMLARARTMRGPDQRAALLTALARALARPFVDIGGMPWRAALWHEALHQCGSLPSAMRLPIWVELAKGAAHELSAAADGDVAAQPADTCWHSIIEVIARQMTPAQASEAMVAMVEAVDGHAELADDVGPLIALMAAASRLPDPLAVPVLTRVIEQAHRNASSEVFRSIWIAVFDASHALEPVLQQKVLGALGQRLGYADGMVDRWLALTERVAALPTALRFRPLLDVLHSEMNPELPAAITVPRLMTLLDGFDDDDRPTMLAAMMHVYNDDLPSWRAMVHAAVQLPLRQRLGPFLAIAQNLATGCALPEVGTPLAARPYEVSFATWPTAEPQARRQFTELLGMLTWADRGALLLSLAPCAHFDRMIWLIEEGMQLPRSGRHEVRLLTTLAERANRLTDINDAVRILPALARAICTLPPDQCASAVYWLADACAKHNLRGLFDPVRDRFDRVLPSEDSRPGPLARGALKRKAPVPDIDG